MISFLGELVSVAIVISMALGYLLVVGVPMLGIIGGFILVFGSVSQTRLSGDADSTDKYQGQKRLPFRPNKKLTQKRRAGWALAYR